MGKPNWCELPEELLRIIAEKLEFSHDFIRFGAVCHTWRSVTLTLDKSLLFLKSFPWLMLPADDEVEDQDDDNRRFCIPFENKFCNMNVPEAHGCHCWGSPYGWLLTLGFDQQFHLLNPFSRVRLPLPHRSTFQDSRFTDETPGDNRICCVGKAVIVSTSASPSPKPQPNEDDLLVVLSIGESQRFAFARPGDKVWSVIREEPGMMKDFINFNGQFYGVCSQGRLMVCNFNDSSPTFIAFGDPPDDVLGDERFYLVELGGELHMVIRIVRRKPIPILPKEFHHIYKSVVFDVVKFNLCTQKWEDVDILGDHAIFIGSNTTFVLKASDYPGCKPGSIYFTDDYHEPFGRLIGADMGIYNLEDGTIEPVYQGDDFLSRFSPPIWIIPNPF